MSFLRMNRVPTILAQNIHQESSTQKEDLGTEIQLADGRKFVYCKNAAVALAVALLVVSADTVANHTDEDVAAAAAIGATSVSLTLGATAVTKNQYRDGFVSIISGAGLSYSYKIRSHPAADSAGNLVVQLYDEIKVALTTASNYNLQYHECANVVLAPSQSADVADLPVGFTGGAITASYFFWAQTRGLCPMLADEAVAKGLQLTMGTGVDGRVEAADAANEKVVGHTIEALVDDESRMAYATIR